MKIKLTLCGTVLTTLLLGGSAYPNGNTVKEKDGLSAYNSPAALVLNRIVENDGDKQQKQSLFGLDVVLNINKTQDLFPLPAQLNVDGSYGEEMGAGASLVLPSLSFPLNLLFPSYPPFNFTIGFNEYKNMSLAVNAAKGNITTTTPPPPGWTEPPATSGWAWAPSTEPPTTSGWGWVPPSTEAPTTSGWGWAPQPQPTAAPPSGWTPSTTTTTPAPTPGWRPGPQDQDRKPSVGGLSQNLAQSVNSGRPQSATGLSGMNPPQNPQALPAPPSVGGRN